MKKIIYILIIAGLTACGNTGNNTEKFKSKSFAPIGTESQSWLQIGKIKAFDEDGDALEFAQIDGRVTPFYVDRCGMIIVKDESMLKVGKYKLKVQAKELYTKERYSVQAIITIIIKEGTSTGRLQIASLNGEIVYYKGRSV